MFCYQKNTHFSQAVSCSREEFWKSIRDAQNIWKIESRRAILKAVETHDEEAIQKWLQQIDYQKFLANKEGKKNKKFLEKSDEERLLAFAQDLKENMVAFIFCCHEFDATATKSGSLFRHRCLKDCHLNGLVMLDIDHVENPMAIYEAWKAQDDLVKRTGIVHITSSRRGIRFVFTADMAEGNLADNQIVFSRALGYNKPDESCIDATRNSFAPKEDDILYINEDLLFGYYDEAFDQLYTPQYRMKKTQPLYHKFEEESEELTINNGNVNGNGNRPSINNEQITTRQLVNSSTCQLEWRGHNVQKLIDAKFGEKLPCADDSNRHNESLKLASDLLILFDGDKKKTLEMLKAQSWVQEIIEERDENVQQTVESALERMREKEKKYLSQLPSSAMQNAIKEVTGKTYQENTGSEELRVKNEESAGAKCQLATINCQLEEWGEKIEALSKDYPILKDITRGLKKNQYPAALFVAGGFMMTLMTRCSYRFYHRPEERRRLNNSTLIIGDPASGKSFANRLYHLLAAPIIEADQEGKNAVNAYRELIRTKGANKDKPQKPKVIIRVHPARTSNAQFINDMVNAVEEVDGEKIHLHMLTFDTELDNTVMVQKGGSWIDKMSLELKAFHNEEDGQSYSNTDSILQDFNVYWNYIYTGTPIALKKKVNEQNFGSGLATRLTCIPLPATRFKMLSRESTVDYESDLRLKDWAYKLDRMKGELSLQKIVDELYDWTARRMADAEENESDAEEMLLKRCAYHGLNFSAPFIVMRHWDKMRQDGQYWCGEFETDETDWALAELIVNIQYACQRHFFGAMAEAYFENKNRIASVNVQRKKKTYEGFSRLPEEFTVEDVMRCFKIDNEGTARVKVMRLMDDHLAEKVGETKPHKGVKLLYRKTGVLML